MDDPPAEDPPVAPEEHPWARAMLRWLSPVEPAPAPTPPEPDPPEAPPPASEPTDPWFLG